MDGIAKRQRQLRTTSYPSSVEQVIDEVTPKFGPIVGGMNDPKTYMGDAFLITQMIGIWLPIQQTKFERQGMIS